MPLLDNKDGFAHIIKNLADRALVDLMEATTYENTLLLEKLLVIDCEKHGRNENLAHKH